MRRSTLVATFVTLCTLAAPAVAGPAADPIVEVQPDPQRKPATPEELEQYAERERAAEKQKEFVGGRMRQSDLITIILVLLIVVLVLAIV